MNSQEIIMAKKLISKMPFDKVTVLREIYGQRWSGISSPTTFGKDFKAEYDKGSFPNLKWHGVKLNGPNHEQYE